MLQFQINFISTVTGWHAPELASTPIDWTEVNILQSIITSLIAATDPVAGIPGPVLPVPS